MTDTEVQIKHLIDEGDALAEQQDYEAALAKYRAAVGLVPTPFNEEEVSTVLLTAIGDVYFLMGEFEKADRAFTDVMLCPGAPASEYIRMRRGQIAFELGDKKKAKSELVVAYMNGGEEVFEGEDPRYLAFIRPTLDALRD